MATLNNTLHVTERTTAASQSYELTIPSSEYTRSGLGAAIADALSPQVGGVHRIAATLDQQVQLVAGCFSRDPENTRTTGEQLYLDPARCYDTFEEMAIAESRLPEGERIDFVTIVTPNISHFPKPK